MKIRKIVMCVIMMLLATAGYFAPEKSTAVTLGEFYIVIILCWIHCDQK